MEHASQILITACSTGQSLNVLSDELVEKTAKDWEKIVDFSRGCFEEMKEMVIEGDLPILV